MVVNQEFNYRGWLPAGLVLNARLLSTAKAGTNVAVLKPVINPHPGKGWPTLQPAPVFPIDQASEDKAIILRDSFPDGALALLFSPEWMGSGTPYILATNTWYDGRISIVSGADVMGVRLVPTAYEEYYSYYGAPVTEKDVRVFNMPCRYIVGKGSDQVLALDAMGVSMEDIGYPPFVSSGETQIPARVVDLLQLSSYSFAGMTSAYGELNPGTEVHILQCSVVAGKLGGKEPKAIGLIAAPKASRQKFYMLEGSTLMGPLELIGNGGTYATVASGRDTAGSEQLVHYN